MMVQVPAPAGAVRSQYWTQMRKFVYESLAN